MSEARNPSEERSLPLVILREAKPPTRHSARSEAESQNLRKGPPNKILRLRANDTTWRKQPPPLTYRKSIQEKSS